jgi:hypothetical protein
MSTARDVWRNNNGAAKPQSTGGVTPLQRGVALRMARARDDFKWACAASAVFVPAGFRAALLLSQPRWAAATAPFCVACVYFFDAGYGDAPRRWADAASVAEARSS